MVVEALDAEKFFALVDAAVHGGVTPWRIAAKQKPFFFSQRLHNLDERFSYQRANSLRSAQNCKALERQRLGGMYCVLLSEWNMGGVHPLYLQRKRLGAAVALISKSKVI